MVCLRGAYAALARRRMRWGTKPDGVVGRHLLPGPPFMFGARARIAKIKHWRKSVLATCWTDCCVSGG